MCGSLLSIVGCSNETDTLVTCPVGKQPIELAVGVDNASTRAVTVEQPIMEALPEGTALWMIMKSDYATLSDASLNYSGNTDTKYCVTKGTTATTTTTENPVAFALEDTRYWDDAHARSSELSVWALAVPGVATQDFGLTASSFEATVPAELSAGFAWSLSAAQTATTIAAEDLCFSNNIADNTSYSAADARLKFDAAANPKVFDKGKLVFYHALTKITIRLVEGDGFNTSSDDDFNLDNIALKGFSLGGTFNVAQGEFTSTDATTTITSLYNKGKDTNANHNLEALVMPGTSLDGDLADAVAFSVDGSVFKVSAATLKSKIAGFTKFEAGKNYIFTFRVSKTGISVTATIAPWTDVTAETAYPKITIDKCYGQETDGNDFGKAFSLYLSETVNSGYAKKADVSSTYGLTPALYWPNHETHYFFRGIWPEVKAEGTPAEKVSGTAISVANSAYSEGRYPSDLMLGYPRKADGTADETCKVHTSPATQGICADEHNIHLNFQYVMSQVEVKLSTSTGADKVVLDGNTTIKIIDGYSAGTIALADGTATGTTQADYTMNGGTYADRLDAIIPQSLSDLKFRITVKDADNKYDTYEATIADIEVTPTGGTKGKITSWQPGKKYFYSLYITKTGIKVTATLKDWETVTSNDNHIWM